MQEQYPDFCFSTMGLHPTSVNDDYTTELETIKNRLTAKKYIAIGEIGLDLYWETSFVNQQKEIFKTQLQWALELNLPVIIHVRKAFAEVFVVGGDGVGAERFAAGGLQPSVERDGEEAAEEADQRHDEHDGIRHALRQEPGDAEIGRAHV